MDRKELQGLARVRLKEARALLESGMPDGAFYLAGYAVECALKACIAKSTRRGEFPDRKKVESSHSHNLLQLCRVAGLEDDLRAHVAANVSFRTNWDYLQSWSEQSRYRRHSPESARALWDAVGHQRNGVLSRIKQRW